MLPLSLALLAEAEPLTNGVVGGMVGAAGGVGFAIWYGYHVTTHTIPALVKDFREERLADREERKEEREEFKQALTQVTDAVRNLPCQSKAFSV